MDNFEQGEEYSAQIASHQAELRREGKFTDQKSLNISSLQYDYLNLVSRSGLCRDIERENNFQTECTFCGVINHYIEQCFKRTIKE